MGSPDDIIENSISNCVRKTEAQCDSINRNEIKNKYYNGYSGANGCNQKVQSMKENQRKNSIAEWDEKTKSKLSFLLNCLHQENEIDFVWPFFLFFYWFFLFILSSPKVRTAEALSIKGAWIFYNFLLIFSIFLFPNFRQMALKEPQMDTLKRLNWNIVHEMAKSHSNRFRFWLPVWHILASTFSCWLDS